MYFNLYNHCALNNNVVYNLLLQKQFFVDEDLLKVLQQFIAHKSSEELVKLYGTEMLKKFENFIINNNIGKFLPYLSANEEISSYNKYTLSLHSATPFEIEQIVLELTNQCNLDCSFCTDINIVYRSCGCRRVKALDILDDKKFLEIAEEIILLQPKTVVFSGGEPLLRKELLMKMITKFSDANILSIVYTNGELLDEYIMNFFYSNSVILIFQIVSHNDSSYKQITKSNVGYLELLDKINYYKNINGKIIFTLVVCKENENDLNETLKFLDANNIEAIKAYIYPPSTSATTLFYDESIFYKNKLKLQVNIHNFNYLKQFNSCLADSIFINSDGLVFPCMGLRKYILGNLQFEKLYEVFRREDYRNFWELSKNKINYCSNCGYNLACQDCRALELQVTGNIKDMHYCNLVLDSKEHNYDREDT